MIPKKIIIRNYWNGDKLKYWAEICDDYNNYIISTHERASVDDVLNDIEVSKSAFSLFNLDIIIEPDKPLGDFYERVFEMINNNNELTEEEKMECINKMLKEYKNIGG